MGARTPYGRGDEWPVRVDTDLAAGLDPSEAERWARGWQANNSPDRLTQPLLRRDGEFVEVDWDTAMEAMVWRSCELFDGPGGWGRFGFHASGQPFLEAYYTLAVIGKAASAPLPFAGRYGEQTSAAPDGLDSEIFSGPARARWGCSAISTTST